MDPLFKKINITPISYFMRRTLTVVNGDIDNFIDYINSTIEKIHQENKICLVMGDSNIDLLKFESHSRSDDSFKLDGFLFFLTIYFATY